MKTALIALGLIGITTNCFAQSELSTQEITQKIIHSVTNYANSVACSVKVKPEDIATLVPYRNSDDRFSAKYAVLWGGDIGCAGGSGTYTTNIAIVSGGMGESFLIDPTQSSPAINFDIPVRYVDKIVWNSSNSIILEGKEYGPNDPNCCPSVRIRFTMEVDKSGNWKMTGKQLLRAK